jgi:NADP-dependent 3-hydroxy acid dehydrogenase YdfG
VKIDGSTILVTGASGGIGRSIATDLADHGARVIAVARSEDQLEELAGTSPSIEAKRCDLTDDDARTALFESLDDVPDAVINNAGSAWVGKFLDMDIEEVRQLLALNVDSLVAVCATVLPRMLERDRGHIVNIGSILGFAPGPPVTMYSATKAAVHAFTEGLRRELVGTDVRITLVAPGPVKDTGALEQNGDEEATATIQKAFDAFGTTPGEVARAVRTALERDGKPSSRTVTVPRIAGLSRVASIPGADWAMDRGYGILKRAGLNL